MVTTVGARPVETLRGFIPTYRKVPRLAKSATPSVELTTYMSAVTRNEDAAAWNLDVQDNTGDSDPEIIPDRLAVFPRVSRAQAGRISRGQGSTGALKYKKLHLQSVRFIHAPDCGGFWNVWRGQGRTVFCGPGSM